MEWLFESWIKAADNVSAGMEARGMGWMLGIVLPVLLSLFLNVGIALVYRATYRGTKYSQDYVHTLLILGTAVTMVILAIQGKAGTAFGAFAAFSIIRFRSAVGQTRDIAFIFLAMTTGMTVGAGLYRTAILGALTLCVVIAILSKLNVFQARVAFYQLKLRLPSDVNYEEKVLPIIKSHCVNWSLDLVESVQSGQMTEVRYVVSFCESQRMHAAFQVLRQIEKIERLQLTPVATTSGLSW